MAAGGDRRRRDHALPPRGRYRLDPEATAIGFAVRELGVIVVRGRFTGVTGEGRVPDRVEGSTVTATVDVRTLRTGNDKRDADLLGPRFLDATAHPAMRFTSTRLSDYDGGWLLTGRLELRGVSRPVTLRLDPAWRTDDGAVVLRPPPRWIDATSGSRCPGCSSAGGSRSTSKSPLVASPLLPPLRSTCHGSG